MQYRINLQTKLFLAFLIPTSTALFEIASSSGTVTRLMRNTNHLSQTNLPTINGLWKIREGRTQIVSAETALLQHGLSKQERTVLLDQIQKAWQQIETGKQEAFQFVHHGRLLQPGQTFLLDWQIWQRSHETFLEKEYAFQQMGMPDPQQEKAELDLADPAALTRLQNIETALTLRQSLLEAEFRKRTAFLATEDALNSLLTDSQAVAQQVRDDALEEVEIAERLAFSLFLFLPVTTGMLAWFLSRKIANPIDRQIQTMIHDLESARDTLEEQVQARTQELQTTIEELKKAQIQLVQAEKMSSLGQLVAGIAHEINNPVSFIHGNLPHLEQYTDEILNLLHLYQVHYPQPVSQIQVATEEAELEFIQADLAQVLNSMRIGTDRIREIVLSLRNFSRLDEAEFKPVNLHDGIESTLLILQHRLKPTAERADIQIIRDYAQLPNVECLAGQLNQVFMNILSNAIDALETSRHPQITIRTSVLEAWIEIAIANNGPEIPEAIQPKIFDPFFTTKPIGKGTGMGMSISYQIIVEKHHGKLEYFSTENEGTEFVIQIPIQQTYQL